MALFTLHHGEGRQGEGMFMTLHMRGIRRAEKKEQITLKNKSKLKFFYFLPSQFKVKTYLFNVKV